MGLDPREQRALKSIGESLSGSDPGLASLLATFTKLTAAEEMPGREKIMPGEAPRGIQAWLPHPGAVGWPLSPGGRSSVLKRVGLAVWLAMALGLIAIALAVSGGARSGACAGHPAATCFGCSAATPAYGCPLAHGIITTP